MRDTYKEQIVKKLPDGSDLLIKIGAVVHGFILMYLVMIFLNPLLPYVFATIILGLYVFSSWLSIEFEYISRNTHQTYDFTGLSNIKKLKIIFQPNGQLIEAMLPYFGQRKFLK